MIRLAGWLLEGLVLLQRDLRDARTPRPIRPDWPLAFGRLVVLTFTVELALATCTLAKIS